MNVITTVNRAAGNTNTSVIKLETNVLMFMSFEF